MDIPKGSTVQASASFIPMSESIPEPSSTATLLPAFTSSLHTHTSPLLTQSFFAHERSGSYPPLQQQLQETPLRERSQEEILRSTVMALDSLILTLGSIHQQLEHTSSLLQSVQFFAPKAVTANEGVTQGFVIDRKSFH